MLGASDDDELINIDLTIACSVYFFHSEQFGATARVSEAAGRVVVCSAQPHR
jgi:hypothetical protein